MSTLNALYDTFKQSHNKQEARINYDILIHAIMKKFDIDYDLAENMIKRILPKPKDIVATRTVPYWWPEEMGSNGLMWTDAPRK